MKKLSSFIKTRAFRAGGYSLAAAAVVVAIAVIVNMLAGALPSRVTSFDLTSSGVFSLTDQSRTMVSALDKEVSVYWIVREGSEDEYLSRLLERYAELSDKLTVEKVDPVVYPGFASEYTSSVTDNSLVITCGSQSRYVDNSDIYQYDYSNYYTTGSYDVSFAGENAVTSAIDYVTSGDLPLMYVLTGHGEQSLSAEMSSAIGYQNVTVAELSLLTAGAVPEDADCLLVNCPESDISQDEAAALGSYIESGGAMLLFTGYGTQAQPNLIALMESYGVTSRSDLVIEGDSSYCLSGYAYYLLPEIQSHEITEPLRSGGYYILAPEASGITVMDVCPENVTVTSLLTTSDSAYSKSDVLDGGSIEYSEGDLSGPFSIGVAAEYAAESGETGRVVWFSSPGLMSADMDSIVSGANSDLVLNAISYLTGEESGVSIHAKSLTSQSLTVSSWSWVMIAVLPLAAIAAGVAVTVWRKRR